MRITKVVTAHDTSSATAVVLTSTDSSAPPGSVQTFTLVGHIIEGSSYGSFCGAKAPVGGCGA